VLRTIDKRGSQSCRDLVFVCNGFGVEMVIRKREIRRRRDGEGPSEES
jgi:hypothetical protein